MHTISEKFNAVNLLADYWTTNLPKKPDNNPWIGLLTLLGKYSIFAKQYEDLLKQAPAIANPGFILNQGAENLLEVFSVVSRACEQRGGSLTGDNSLVPSLFKAEAQMNTYCSKWQPGIGSPYLKLETPVVYFEKIYDISRALVEPQIPVVSLPLTEYNQNGRWQALAHEFGHHIYWNALSDIKEVAALHQRMLDTLWMANIKNVEWENWLEEVFADLCGILLAGPEYLDSCQFLAVERVRTFDDYVEDDQEHPSMYVRPVICSYALERIANANPNPALEAARTRLSERWQSYDRAIQEKKKDRKVQKPSILDQIVVMLGGNTDQNELNDLKPALLDEARTVALTILESKVWPGGKSLLDLVEYYNKTGLSQEQLASLEGVVPPENFVFLPPVHQDEPLIGPQDADIPDSLKDLWGFLKSKMKDHDPLKEWTTLLDLSLEEDHTHFKKHKNFKKHTPWGISHKHGDGNTIIPE